MTIADTDVLIDYLANEGKADTSKRQIVGLANVSRVPDDRM
jgi:predicted nucleic-acid-binding protein